MAQDTQLIEVIGRLGADPESRFTADGTQITSFSLAANNRDGSTTWYRVSAFAKLGEICNQYLTKGKQVFIAGDFTFRTYEKKDGGTGYSLDIKADKMQMLGGKGDSEGGSAPSTPRGKNAPQDIDDSELPF